MQTRESFCLPLSQKRLHRQAGGMRAVYPALCVSEERRRRLIVSCISNGVQWAQNHIWCACLLNFRRIFGRLIIESHR